MHAKSLFVKAKVFFKDVYNKTPNCGWCKYNKDISHS